METLRRMIVVALTVLALCFTHNASAEPSAQTTQAAMQEFAAQYKRAASEAERMQLCINATNSGLIYISMPIEDIDVLFNTNYKTKIPSKSQKFAAGVIQFKPPEVSPDYFYPVVFGGWYFAFSFNESGKVTDFSLSNVYIK